MDRFFSQSISRTWAWAGAALALSSAHTSATAQPDECRAVSTHQIEKLFDDWNQALQTNDPGKVVALYADGSTLLPTLHARPRLTRAEKLEYFEKFLQLKPVGKIDEGWVDIGCNSAVRAGLYTFDLEDGRAIKARYTFTYEYRDGEWKITSHHSSLLPP